MSGNQAEVKDLIIIGTGPGGLTAAIYAARSDLNLLVIEGSTPGGQLTTTSDVENFPGFPQGISGPQLMDNMKKQAARFGAEFVVTKASKVDFSKRPFTVVCENGKSYSGKTVIVSTGASARYLGLANEKELIGKGVSACATCDGFFYRDKTIHLVGGGDAAMEEANFLTKFASKVYIVHRRDALRATPPMQRKVFDNPKIEVIWDTVVEEILADEAGVNGLIVKNVKTNETTTRKTDGLFISIGHNPNTDFLEGQLEIDDHGFIKADKASMATSVPGVFACGDVQDSEFRQAIVAAGSGCMAAMTAGKFLEESGLGL